MEHYKDVAITERQNLILNRVIGEYINSAQPVSSQWLEKKCDLGICPATIRAEMQKLSEEGYLVQPHTSAGRVPTDKGYRFFVDGLLETNFENFDEKLLLDSLREIREEDADALNFIQLFTKNLALASSNLALLYLLEKDFLWKEGWAEVLEEPEFRNFDYTLHFVKMVNAFEKEIRNFVLEEFSKPKVYIGKENPLLISEDFSIIISRCRLPQSEKGGILAVLGPKRMSYQKNIVAVDSLVKLLEDF